MSQNVMAKIVVLTWRWRLGLPKDVYIEGIPSTKTPIAKA